MDYNKLKAGLDSCTNPVFLFDDDPDGVCAFLTLYNYKQEGHGMILKTSPHITTDFLSRIEVYNPDALFILDIAHVDQEFVNKIKIPVYWVDHHEPQDIDKVVYINPKKEGKNISTTELCYNTVSGLDWIAMIGAVSDWMLPDFTKEFIKKYPDLLNKDVKTPPQALFETKLGELIRIISFVLKGSHKDAMKYIKVLTRIEKPEELLNPQTSQGKFIQKRYKKVKERFDFHWNHVKDTRPEDGIVLYRYSENRLSFSSDLSNQALYLFKDKVIIIGRENEKEVVCSIRSPDINILNILKKAVQQVRGYGGGHDKAVGCGIKKEDFARFVEIFKEELSN